MNAVSTLPADHLSAAFAALADPTRRAILARLAEGETSVGDLVKPFSISGPAISRHLRVLENAKLIERKVDAQWRICKLNAPGLRAPSDWLQQYREFWEQSLDRLVEVLESADGHPARRTGPAPEVSRVPSSPRRPFTKPKSIPRPGLKKRKSP